MGSNTSKAGSSSCSQLCVTQEFTGGDFTPIRWSDDSRFAKRLLVRSNLLLSQCLHGIDVCGAASWNVGCRNCHQQNGASMSLRSESLAPGSSTLISPTL